MFYNKHLLFLQPKNIPLWGVVVVVVGESEASIENNEESKIKNKIVKAEEGNKDEGLYRLCNAKAFIKKIQSSGS